MRSIFAMIVGLAIACVTGCNSESRGLSDPSQATGVTLSQTAPTAGSLFPGDQAVLSNDQIDQILGSKVYPPAHGRVAVVRMGQRYPYWWMSEELSALDQQTTAQLVDKLRSSPRVADALLLPSLLVPQQMTIPYLREAAARVQADSLLVYRTYTQTYQVSRLFAPDETRAHCTVEALLLDTRTGIITTTAVATQNFKAQRRGGDISFDETIGRAEQKAIGQALARVGDELLHFLNAAPLPETIPTTRSIAESAGH